MPSTHGEWGRVEDWIWWAVGACLEVVHVSIQLLLPEHSLTMVKMSLSSLARLNTLRNVLAGEFCLSKLYQASTGPLS